LKFSHSSDGTLPEIVRKAKKALLFCEQKRSKKNFVSPRAAPAGLFSAANLL
jgi:hypothetical protein